MSVIFNITILKHPGWLLEAEVTHTATGRSNSAFGCSVTEAIDNAMKILIRRIKGNEKVGEYLKEKDDERI